MVNTCNLILDIADDGIQPKESVVILIVVNLTVVDCNSVFENVLGCFAVCVKQPVFGQPGER